MVLPEVEKRRSGEADVAGIASTREGTGKPLLVLILIAFITGNSSLEPLIEGLCAQIHVNLR